MLTSANGKVRPTSSELAFVSAVLLAKAEKDKIIENREINNCLDIRLPLVCTFNVSKKVQKRDDHNLLFFQKKDRNLRSIMTAN